jgi:hypothetical protein
VRSKLNKRGPSYIFDKLTQLGFRWQAEGRREGERVTYKAPLYYSYLPAALAWQNTYVLHLTPFGKVELSEKIKGKYNQVPRFLYNTHPSLELNYEGEKKMWMNFNGYFVFCFRDRKIWTFPSQWHTAFTATIMACLNRWDYYTFLLIFQKIK